MFPKKTAVILGFLAEELFYDSPCLCALGLGGKMNRRWMKKKKTVSLRSCDIFREHKQDACTSSELKTKLWTELWRIGFVALGCIPIHCCCTGGKKKKVRTATPEDIFSLLAVK